MSRLIGPLLVVTILSTSAISGPIVIDGNLTDWGIQVADDNGSNMNGYAGIGVPGFLGAFTEDQNDTTNNLFLGPNHGGQNYDAELMAAASDGTFLYLAIVTGQRPDNGFRFYGPGDIRIVAGGVTYGIEVGGGQGGVAVSDMLSTGGDGATYTLDGSGYTVGFTAHGDTQLAGSMWRNPDWILDPINPQGETQLLDQFTGGDHVGDIEFVYTLNAGRDAADSLLTQHAMMEMAIPLAYLGSTSHVEVYWRPSCGNDELNLCIECMPEPGSSMLLIIGGLGLAGALVREKRRGQGR